MVKVIFEEVKMYYEITNFLSFETEYCISQRKFQFRNTLF